MEPALVAEACVAGHSMLAYGILLSLNALFAGPMFTMVCGGLLEHYPLGIFPVYACTVLGDVVNDGLYYWIGRCHASLPERVQLRLSWMIGTTAELASLRSRLESRPYQVLVMAKIKYGVGFTKLMQAGASGFSYRRFATTCFSVTPIQAAIFLGVGMIGGSLEQDASFYVRAATICLIGFTVAYSPVKRMFAKKCVTKKK